MSWARCRTRSPPPAPMSGCCCPVFRRYSMRYRGPARSSRVAPCSVRRASHCVSVGSKTASRAAMCGPMCSTRPGSMRAAAAPIKDRMADLGTTTFKDLHCSAGLRPISPQGNSTRHGVRTSCMHMTGMPPSAAATCARILVRTRDRSSPSTTSPIKDSSPRTISPFSACRSASCDRTVSNSTVSCRS